MILIVLSVNFMDIAIIVKRKKNHLALKDLLSRVRGSKMDEKLEKALKTIKHIEKLKIMNIDEERVASLFEVWNFCYSNDSKFEYYRNIFDKGYRAGVEDSGIIGAFEVLLAEARYLYSFHPDFKNKPVNEYFREEIEYIKDIKLKK